MAEASVCEGPITNHLTNSVHGKERIVETARAGEHSHHGEADARDAESAATATGTYTLRTPAAPSSRGPQKRRWSAKSSG